MKKEQMATLHTNIKSNHFVQKKPTNKNLSLVQTWRGQGYVQEHLTNCGAILLKVHMNLLFIPWFLVSRRAGKPKEVLVLKDSPFD